MLQEVDYYFQREQIVVKVMWKMSGGTISSITETNYMAQKQDLSDHLDRMKCTSQV